MRKWLNIFVVSNDSNLTGSSFLGLGSLGILPYINASIVIQLLTPVIPALEKLQKEEGELGREQITKYTRYLTFVWALAISTGVAFALVKPVTFNQSDVNIELNTGTFTLNKGTKLPAPNVAFHPNRKVELVNKFHKVKYIIKAF